jgi:hypothetical protein
MGNCRHLESSKQGHARLAIERLATRTDSLGNSTKCSTIAGDLNLPYAIEKWNVLAEVSHSSIDWFGKIDIAR